MCTLTKITKLYLSGNKIKVIPNEISLLQSLVLLDLSNVNLICMLTPYLIHIKY